MYVRYLQGGSGVIVMDELKLRIETEEYIYEEWIIHRNLYKGANKENETGE
tara:strand:+ start:164 stop:316 length:153 start_codon:yes stop_codon:yes gene_type:complete